MFRKDAFGRYTVILGLKGHVSSVTWWNQNDPRGSQLEVYTNLDKILGFGVKLLKLWRQSGNIYKSVACHYVGFGVWGGGNYTDFAVDYALVYIAVQLNELTK